MFATLSFQRHLLLLFSTQNSELIHKENTQTRETQTILMKVCPYCSYIIATEALRGTVCQLQSFSFEILSIQQK